MAFTKITSDGVADNAITASKIATGAVTVADIPDGEITSAKLSSSLQSTIAAAITKDSSTGAANIPSGTTAQRPSSPSNGMIRYNTTTNSLENYTSQGWLKVSSIIPTTISSISGSIYAGLASTLAIAGTGFLSSNCIVTFAANGISNQDVSVTASSNTSLTVSVPSAIYSTLSAGVNVNITVTNSDLGTSVAYGMTTIAIPFGGSISTYSTYKVHTFTGSSNFVIPSGFLSTYDYIVVAGGGGCGNSSGWGGGGGAGGLVYQTSQSLTAGTYAISIGAGGGPGSQGGNSSAFGQTAIGGGRGGDDAINNGGAGGSGGGGRGDPANIIGGSATAGQGYAGGNGYDPSPGESGGGGGGAGGAGDAGSSTSAGNGGLGRDFSTVFGTSVGESGWFASGGGGSIGRGDQLPWNNSSASASSGWSYPGGGGTGGQSSYASAGVNGENGMSNTGGGAGAGNGTYTGGSGVVIIRYPIPT